MVEMSLPSMLRYVQLKLSCVAEVFHKTSFRAMLLQDERAEQLSLYPFVERVYLERILRP